MRKNNDTDNISNFGIGASLKNGMIIQIISSFFARDVIVRIDKVMKI